MALAAKGHHVPKIAYFTFGTQDAPNRGAGSYLHAGLWGLARTARLEDASLSMYCFDLDVLDPDDPDATAQVILEQLGSVGGVETELALSGGPYVPRLCRCPVQLQKPMRLEMKSRGSLSNLRVVPLQRASPDADQVELRVRAVGLNFRDVLNVMDLYPGDPGNPGGDCAGTVCAVGCLQAFACTEGLLMVPKPKRWSFEQMVAWPVTFATAEEAFVELAPLKLGERVLIHAATGGVGLVAVQLAQRMGATIFATAGSPEKVQYLRDRGVKYITSSRDAQQFEEDMKTFLQKDGAEDGVDVVLNSLSHEGFIPKSLAFLSKGGRFMEIGKRGVWSHERMRLERPDVQYEKIAMDWVMEYQPERFNLLLARLVGQVEEGLWEEVPLTLHEGLGSGVEALRYMQRAQHIGKVVLTQPSRMGCHADGTYFLSGGLGALGLVTSEMMAEEGAKSMVLLSRRGVVNHDLREAWKRLESFDIEILIKACDVAQHDEVEGLVTSITQRQPSYNVRGLMHLAAVLDDATLPKLTEKHLESAYAAKVWGSRHLHVSLKSRVALDFMVLFSSTSALLGSPGQAFASWEIRSCALSTCQSVHAFLARPGQLFCSQRCLGCLCAPLEGLRLET
ncbi:ppsC [Symbiodinium sp. CCMP2592]|nr:ppsC [Symbiodinium sp. CCMP2592]